jgi:ATP-dependent DNA ligase
MPVSTTLTPMEARSVAAIPAGSQWQYEPKWDGFRCLLERGGKNVTLTSKSGQDLGRYFPEVAGAALRLPETHFILDGELIIQREEEFSFDALLQRIHPAASRIKRLAAETPAHFIAFDLLKRGKQELVKEHLPKRRKALEAFAARGFDRTLFVLSPASTKIEDAKRWLRSAGATGLSPSAAIFPISRAIETACKKSNAIAAPIAWSAVSAMAKAPGRLAGWWAHFFWDCMMRKAFCIMSDLPPVSNQRKKKS